MIFSAYSKKKNIYFEYTVVANIQIRQCALQLRRTPH